MIHHWISDSHWALLFSCWWWVKYVEAANLKIHSSKENPGARIQQGNRAINFQANHLSHKWIIRSFQAESELIDRKPLWYHIKCPKHLIQLVTNHPNAIHCIQEKTAFPLKVWGCGVSSSPQTGKLYLQKWWNFWWQEGPADVGLPIGTHDLKEIVVLLLGHDRRTCPLGRKNVSGIERTTGGFDIEAVTLCQVIISWAWILIDIPLLSKKSLKTDDC